MTSTVTRVVDISVSRLAGIQSLAAFDIPAVITAETPNASFGVSNRAKKYLVGSLTSVGTDFGTSSETYKAARAIVSQRPTASSFYIIKRGAAVARVKTLTFSADMATGQTATVWFTAKQSPRLGQPIGQPLLTHWPPRSKTRSAWILLLIRLALI